MIKMELLICTPWQQYLTLGLILLTSIITGVLTGNCNGTCGYGTVCVEKQCGPGHRELCYYCVCYHGYTKITYLFESHSYAEFCSKECEPSKPACPQNTTCRKQNNSGQHLCLCADSFTRSQTGRCTDNVHHRSILPSSTQSLVGGIIAANACIIIIVLVVVVVIRRRRSRKTGHRRLDVFDNMYRKLMGTHAQFSSLEGTHKLTAQTATPQDDISI